MIGVDLGLRHERDADEFIAAVAQDDMVASTHLVTGVGRRHVAMAFATADGQLAERLRAKLDGVEQGALVVGDRTHGTPDLLAGAREALGQYQIRSAGRAVRFAGVDDLVGAVSVARMLRASAIDRVAVLADDDASPETMVVTRNFVRPRWSCGQLVLHTQPNIGGTLVPFETPNPTPCCQDHT